MSHMPGMTVLPVASMTVAPAGVLTASAAPTATIRSPRTTIVWLARITPDSASNRSPPLMTMVPLVAVTTVFASASARASRHLSSIARSAGSSGSAPARTVMNHCTSVASSWPRSSSQMPLGFAVLPRETMTSRAR
jgi:hypothetical protein